MQASIEKILAILGEEVVKNRILEEKILELEKKHEHCDRDKPDHAD